MMHSGTYDDISSQISDLEKDKRTCHKVKKQQDKLIHDIDNRIKLLTKQYPRCSSCGHHFHPSLMMRATQEDVDYYNDQIEGYGGPVVNEYYCGC